MLTQAASLFSTRCRAIFPASSSVGTVMRTTILSVWALKCGSPYGAVMLIEGLTGTIYHDFAGFSYRYTDSTTIILKPQFIHRRGRRVRGGNGFRAVLMLTCQVRSMCLPIPRTPLRSLRAPRFNCFF